jgi:hypothetical protein
MTTWPRGVRFRPIVQWPGETTKTRKLSPFRADWSTTLSELDRELRQLKARTVVIQLALGEHDLRVDGLPRASARPSHPGVILSMDTPHGPLSYPCDQFWNWTDNLRAIVLALAALRAVDRYGVTKHGEQYQGWAQLDSGRPTQGPMTRSEAADFIDQYAVATVQETAWMRAGHQECIAGLYRRAARKLHPDAGGDAELFHKLQDARRVLEGAQ